MNKHNKRDWADVMIRFAFGMFMGAFAGLYVSFSYVYSSQPEYEVATDMILTMLIFMVGGGIVTCIFGDNFWTSS